jgi:hypothetical protein
LKALAAAISLSALGLLLPVPARAQLSPGELSRAHADLEGSANCLRCHGGSQGVDPSGCLSCHEPLAKRIEGGRGLHAQKGYESCGRCHIEHHGREFELIWWGEEGRDRFDHSLTGYPLEGAHVKPACEDCHRPESMVDRAELEVAKKDLGRTFLGLDQACLSCHDDWHRGQVEADSCSSCHDSNAWSPPSLFDHDRTRFALTGLHVGVACSKCHGMLEAEGEEGPVSYLEFPIAAFARCTDCHRDPHEGRLGPTCESCHTTAGWSRFDQRAFDHAETRFPLEGAHQRVGCDLCHLPGAGFRVARFDRCVDCHDDDHLGQFGTYAEQGGCRSCHTVDAFTPATYTLADHQESNYPLEGAHLAIPCVVCHEEVATAELRPHFALVAPPAGQLPDLVRQFRFAGTRCDDCHGDPHEGELDRWLDPAGCEACHDLSSWRSISFDHDRTELPIRGKHAELGCRECHSVGLEFPEGTPFKLTGSSSACSSCHEDAHVGQFAAPDGSVACASCHTDSGWNELLFDHDRDSQYPLLGAHLKVQCSECHPVETQNEVAFIRYKPLGTRCEDCHATFDDIYR